MKSKFFYIFGGVLILVLGIYFFSNYSSQGTTTVYNSKQSANQQSLADQSSSTTAPDASPKDSSPAPTSAKPLDTPTLHFSNESDIDGVDVQVQEVAYDGKNFSPKSLNIKLGDIVVFKNNSNKPFRPASGPHPTHTDYPAFDAKTNIAAGGIFQFKFTKVGSWSYHDHLNDSSMGTIIVSK